MAKMSLFRYTQHFNIHFLMTMQEYAPNQPRPSRLKLLLEFNKRHGHKYDDQVKTAMKTMMMNKKKACWVFDQWYWICHLESPCIGANVLDKHIAAKLAPMVEHLQRVQKKVA